VRPCEGEDGLRDSAATLLAQAEDKSLTLSWLTLKAAVDHFTSAGLSCKRRVKEPRATAFVNRKS
jgi:hypothetical protein